MRVLHAIHDFLPRHRAGSEIYAFELAREQSRRHDVFVLAAEYDPATPHGAIRWRHHDGLAVVEIVNNWEFEAFADTYRSERLNVQIEHVLHATQPDIVHVHNLLNLTFDLPRLAHAHGAAVAATLHDYTLVCASGGQRVHAAEAHVCDTIDPERCRRCFEQSPWSRQMAAGQLTRRRGGRVVARAAAALRRLTPVLADTAGRRLPAPSVSAADMRARLAYARHVFDNIDLFVSPSAALAEEFVALGLPADRLQVADYGFSGAGLPSTRAPRPEGTPLRIGFAGTLVWHKGPHVLLEALAHLSGPFEAHLHGDTGVFPEYVEQLRRLAAGLPVTFHGRFSGAERRAVFESLDVLVVPSLWPENSPLVIHEAFMHGVAVVGARSGGIPGLVRDGVNGAVYDPFSPEALRLALQPLVDDPPRAAWLASRNPAVRSIREDAREWDARYASLREPSAIAAGVS